MESTSGFMGTPFLLQLLTSAIVHERKDKTVSTRMVVAMIQSSFFTKNKKGCELDLAFSSKLFTPGLNKVLGFYLCQFIG